MFVLFEFIEHRINSKIIFISEIFKRCSINQDRIFDLYLGIAAIIGTFLGLYFIAITIISQTVYSKIKGEIRSLLNADKITNLYIEKLIFLLSFVLISIFSMILKYEIGYFNFILTAFLAFITVISFWKLAIRVFNFFNPVYLISIYLLPEINRCLAIVSKNKLFKFDINFQMNSYWFERENRFKKYINVSYKVSL
ncbi:MAG: hypothetical protein LBN01_04235 [Endomicrobium sp.]|jgi:hypothetical protein|nr:hypothetical protein [Endomicrobium sp.]